MFNLGIIGAGQIAAKFANAAKLTPGAAVKAVAAKDRERAREFANAHAIENYYGSYEEMLSCEKLDGVYIATTHNFHYENIMLCIKHGLPVICEKCLVLTEKQAREVFTAAEKAGVFLMEAMWSRFLPAVQKAREWIADGKIGKPVCANYNFAFVSPKDSRIYKPSLAGGAMFDIGVYAIEGLTYLLNGKISRAESLTCWSGEIDESNIIAMDIGGCAAAAMVSVNCSMPTRAEIFGNKGNVLLSDAVNSQRAELYTGGKLTEVFESKHENGFVYQLAHFIEKVGSGALYSDVIPPEDTIECARIFDKVLAGGGK